MKSILMSIQPKWCELIASGKKTVEVRKNKPKIDTPFKVYMYCTKDKNKIFWYNSLYRYIDDRSHNLFDKPLNGKVIGEYICDEIYDIGYSPYNHGGFISNTDNLYRKSCLNLEKMFNYLSQGYGYAWHISDLKIYDKPKELSEFWKSDKCPYVTDNGCTYKYHCYRTGQTKRCGEHLTRPPQSYCYVEEV